MTGALEGRVAIVTGAAGAIGQATCALLAERGAQVVCVVRRPPEPGALPPDAVVLQADVTAEDEVQALVAEVLRSYGRIDVLVNNAGIEGAQALIPDYDTAEFLRVLQVNVLGVFLGLKHVMPAMIAKGSGSIVNLSSIAGVRGAAKMSGYVASKHAVIGLTRSAALEGAPHGVRVNAVLPGFIESRMLGDIANRLGGSMDGLSGHVPMGRLGQPDDPARAIAFLASDDAAYTTGACLMLDGGLTIGL